MITTIKEKESNIQKAILEYLALKKIYAWKNHSTGIFNAKGGGFIPTGKPGVSDILGIMPDGKFLAIEVKKKGGKVSDYQIAFIKDIILNNGIAFVAYSVDDVIKTLSQQKTA